MENIRQAVERARADKSQQPLEHSGAAHHRIEFAGIAQSEPQGHANERRLDTAYLQSKRIMAYDAADQRSRPYDMLRTQVLQTMAAGGWKILGITSPGPGCGKTLTAINLAFSIARHPDQSVILVDLDLQRPQVANSLGIVSPDGGTLDVLQERQTLAGAAIPVNADGRRLIVLPTAATTGSSGSIASRAMRNLLQDFRRTYRSHTVILDLPPILSSDDVIALMPQIDCVLLVAAVEVSKVSEIQECNRHLQASHLIRLVVNKSPDANTHHYYY